MGYPNPAESPYDLFMTGHAGCAPSTALGLKAGDDLMGHPERHSVAVIGDGAFPSGIVFEALNNAGGLQQEVPGHPQRQQDVDLPARRRPGLLPRQGADGPDLQRLEHARSRKLLPTIPLVGDQADRWLQQFKDAIKASLHGGMLFEELGFAYLGPIDGHDLKTLRHYLEKVKAMDGPVLLHVLTDKGHGFEPADEGPGQVPRPRAVPDGRGRDHPAQDLVEQGLHRRRQRRPLRGDGSATRRSPS